MKNSITVLAVILIYSISASAWGGRGHSAICDAAIRLVKNDELRTFLSMRTHMITHLCNIPDTYWRDLGAKSEEGNPTHFFEPDLVNVDLKDTPIEWAEAQKILGDKEHRVMKSKVKSVAKEIGSLWWRVDQLAKLGEKNLMLSKQSPAPQDKKLKQDYNNVYNKSVFEAMISLGVLGHFVADAAQPLHSTWDYDGYAVGKGGLHKFYEETIVAEIKGDLVSQILKTVPLIKNKDVFLKPTSHVEKMKQYTMIAYSELKKVQDIDRPNKPSVYKDESGMKIKIPAERIVNKQTVQKFEPLILTQMSRAAILLSALWDDAYEKAGRPDLKSYESYQFPHQPDIILPDYINLGKP